MPTHAHSSADAAEQPKSGCCGGGSAKGSHQHAASETGEASGCCKDKPAAEKTARQQSGDCCGGH